MVYTPRTPGAAWTTEEILIVKSKLWRMFSSDEAERMVREGGVPSLGNDSDIKGPRDLFLLLHERLRDKGSTTVYDTRMVAVNIWHTFDHNPHDGYFNYPDQTGGDNNGMQALSDLLEGIYIWPAYPSQTPSLQVSLKESGKSRADLWVLSAIAAVWDGHHKYDVQTHNVRV